MRSTSVQRRVRARRFRPRGRSAASFIAACLVVAGCTAAAGCSVVPGWPGIAAALSDPPVVCTACSVSVADRGALHGTAGLYVSIEPTTAQRVQSVDLAFDLYASDGAPLPAFGRNSFVVRIDDPFPSSPGESTSTADSPATFCVSLDGLVPATEASIEASRLRVERVRLAGGATWLNPGSLLCPESE